MSLDDQVHEIPLVLLDKCMTIQNLMIGEHYLSLLNTTANIMRN